MSVHHLNRWAIRLLACLGALANIGVANATLDESGAASLVREDDRAALNLTIDRIGTDQPPRGRSVFDALFTTYEDGKGIYRVPFPFSKVLARLDRALGTAPGSEDSTLKVVLIPYGRCVNRNAAAPDQLAFPRMVVAVDAEPLTIPAENPIFIKNRLFLGYQEKANTIEVISYNEMAGRFEFQVVSDYRDGGTAQVNYAKRSLCLSCHQGGGPVFSRTPWHESSSNRDMMELLVSSGAKGTERLTYPTGSFDRATDQARLLEVYQALWGPICKGKTEAESIRCRAGLFELMLEKRFFNLRNVYSDSPRVLENFLPISAKNLLRDWPDGLPVPDSDVPNRRPLRLEPLFAVSARVDPLRPRSVRLMLGFGELSRLIEGLAEFIPFIDLKRLDRHLYRSGGDSAGVRWRFSGPCEFRKQEHAGDRSLITIDCRVRDDTLGRRFDLIGDLAITGEQANDKEPLNRWLIGDGTYFTNIYHRGGPISIGQSSWRVELGVNAGDSQFQVWLPDGVAIENITLEWPRLPGEQQPIPPQNTFVGSAVMTLRPGYERIAAAVERMVERDELLVFREPTFRGGPAIQALLSELGVDSTKWCCDDWSMMPAVQTTTKTNAADADENLRSFDQYCGDCHGLPVQSPVSFLSGSREEVVDNLTRCAERIYFRLGMWDLARDQREKTPMPPMLHIGRLERSLSPGQIRSDLSAIREYVAGLLESSGEDLMSNGYENTRTCELN